jgi:hypothetical protein
VIFDRKADKEAKVIDNRQSFFVRYNLLFFAWNYPAGPLASRRRRMSSAASVAISSAASSPTASPALGVTPASTNS